MKIKTTKKEMKNKYAKIVGIGYCNAQYLLKFETPFAYSARVEGWACDFYEVGNILISTGYSPLSNENTNCDYTTVTKYDELARIICTDRKLSYEEQKNQVTKLLENFINDIT